MSSSRLTIIVAAFLVCRRVAVCGLVSVTVARLFSQRKDIVAEQGNEQVSRLVGVLFVTSS